MLTGSSFLPALLSEAGVNATTHLIQITVTMQKLCMKKGPLSQLSAMQALLARKLCQQCAWMFWLQVSLHEVFDSSDFLQIFGWLETFIKHPVGQDDPPFLSGEYNAMDHLSHVMVGGQLSLSSALK